jgi:hypothetical protein
MRWITGIATALALAGVAATGHAQVTAKNELTLEGAKRIIAAAYFVVKPIALNGAAK